MFHYKSVPFAFVILCPDRNLGGLKATIRSAAGRYPDAPKIIVVPGSISNKELQEFKVLGDVVKGRDTYTSMINEGLGRTKTEWNFIVFAGSIVKYRFYHKYSYFLEDNKDILFPIADGKYNFIDGTMNGILIHKNAIKDIGDMPEEDMPLETAKLIWASNAVTNGYRFKAIAGARIV